MPMADQDREKGAKPFEGCSTSETVCREVEVRTEDGRYIATLRAIIRRRDIGVSDESREGWLIGALAIDERRVKVKK